MSDLPQFLTDISSEVLTRHYGLSNKLKLTITKSSEIALGKIPGKLLRIQLRDIDTSNVTEIYLWRNTSSKTLYFPLTDEITFFYSVLNSLTSDSAGELNIIGKIPQNWVITDFVKIKMDVTNFHFVIITKKKNYRLKWYSRPSHGYKEFQIQKSLSEFQIAPKAEFLVAYGQKAIFGVYEEINKVRNLDEISGELYFKLINKSITFDQFLIEIRKIFNDINELILRLHNVEYSLLEKKLIDPYSSLEWCEKLNNDWKVVKKSNLFTDKEINKVEIHYLPLLADFLEKTDSGVIHGDIWMRQFGMSPLSNQLRLFDFEDMKMGPVLFDFACQLNSITQQYEYFRIKSKNKIHLSYEYGQTLIKTFISSLPQISNEIKRDLKYCQSLRMIHELKYLLDHQPEEIWLQSFIKQDLLFILEEQTL